MRTEESGLENNAIDSYENNIYHKRRGPFCRIFDYTYVSSLLSLSSKTSANPISVYGVGDGACEFLMITTNPGYRSGVCTCTMHMHSGFDSYLQNANSTKCIALHFGLIDYTV